MKKTKTDNLLENLDKNSNEWGTPQDLFDELNNEFHFTLDVCAGCKEIAKCEKYFDQEKNGLIQDWSNDICFMNPPYGKVAIWMKKAHEECLKGAFVVALTFAKTDTKWFHDICMMHEIRFLKDRLRFKDFNENSKKKEDRAPFGSMITIFKPLDKALE